MPRQRATRIRKRREGRNHSFISSRRVSGGGDLGPNQATRSPATTPADDQPLERRSDQALVALPHLGQVLPGFVAFHFVTAVMQRPKCACPRFRDAGDDAADRVGSRCGQWSWQAAVDPCAHRGRDRDPPTARLSAGWKAPGPRAAGRHSRSGHESARRSPDPADPDVAPGRTLPLRFFDTVDVLGSCTSSPTPVH